MNPKQLYLHSLLHDFIRGQGKVGITTYPAAEGKAFGALAGHGEAAADA